MIETALVEDQRCGQSYVQLSAARKRVALKGPSVFSLEIKNSCSSGYWLDNPSIEDYVCHRISIPVSSNPTGSTLRQDSPEPAQRHSPC